MKCSIGIFACNEERNIGRLLKRILEQETEETEIDEVFVVASGCTDRTIPIARGFEKKDERVEVLVQKKREGKYSALNLFLRRAGNEILVVESADTLPQKDTVEKLTSPFIDPEVGMAGARPVPLNDPETFMGFVNHLLWRIHHRISLETPKMGEMVAFRRVFEEIPRTAVDEVCVESLIREKGLKTVYIPEAIVYNKGAETISDFLKQRRRIYAGHLDLKRTTGYEAPTLGGFRILFLLLKEIEPRFRDLFFTPGAVALEVLARALGWWDHHISRKDHAVWEMAETTRDLGK